VTLDVLQKFRVTGSKVKVTEWRNASEILPNYRQSIAHSSIALNES